MENSIAIYKRAVDDVVRPALQLALDKLGPDFDFNQSPALSAESIGIAKSEWLDDSQCIRWTSFHIDRVNDVSARIVRRVPGSEFPDLPCRIAALSESYFQEQLQSWLTIILSRP